MTAAFEADVHPGTGSPRLRFNFANGWTVSLMLGGGDVTRMRFSYASVAEVERIGEHEGLGRVLEHEASPDEVAAILSEVAERPTIEPLVREVGDAA